VIFRRSLSSLVWTLIEQLSVGLEYRNLAVMLLPPTHRFFG